MTAVTLNHLPTGHNSGSFFTVPKNFLQALISANVNAVRHELAARKAIRTLNSFSDHELADIGLNRGEIETAVRFGR